MKTTKVMLAVIGTFLLTWVLVSLLFCYLGDTEFKTTMAHSIIFMIILGWIPAMIVGSDYSEKLNNF